MLIRLRFRSARLPAINRDGSKTGASNGGVWEWCSTEFAAYEGWRTSELYPGYSEDFFDGCHWIMLGGSFGELITHLCAGLDVACLNVMLTRCDVQLAATIPRVAGRKTFTNWVNIAACSVPFAYDLKRTDPIFLCSTKPATRTSLRELV